MRLLGVSLLVAVAMALLQLAPPASPAAAAVVALHGGDAHSCSVTDGGIVSCWGYNGHGELGDGTTDGRANAEPVAGLGSITELSAGSFHTCAITAAGGVKCWGLNEDGQVGDGTTDNLRTTAVDVVPLGAAAVDVDAGMASTCAVLATSAVRCWGMGYGVTPLSVTGVPGAVDVELGSDYACARNGAGAVGCWSHGWAYQVTMGPTSGVTALAGFYQQTCALRTNSTVTCGGSNPTGPALPGLTAVSEISASPAAVHACALQAGGVKCWGDNGVGQLGDGTHTFSATPVDVQGMGSNVVTIGSGGAHACGLLNTGTMQCWGSNVYGQLGVDPSAPGDVDGLVGALAGITSGGAHSCALTGAGGVKCWGYNVDGQLGDGGACGDPCPVAADVTGLRSGVTTVDAGWFHTCAIMDTGGLKCWGRNFSGQLGDGTMTLRRETPVDVIGLSGGVEAVSAGGYATCALMTGGTVKCWGASFGATPQDVTGLGSGVVDLSAGTFDTCVVTSAGAVVCGLTAWSGPQLQVVPGMESGMVAVSVGEYFVCAITTSGGVKCHGNNEDGQLGHGTVNVLYPSAVDVVGLSDVIAISAGGGHSCALTGSHAVYCWGANYYAQVGIGVLNTIEELPMLVQSLDHGVAAVDAGNGGAHTCALAEAGGVTCWGWNAFAQLGNSVGSGLAPSYVPIDSDSDNCSDGREMGTSPLLGGRRDPLYSWDFFDVPTGSTSLAKDKSIAISDVVQEVMRFGASGDRFIDPLTSPPMGGYHTTYDRGGRAGSDMWDQAPPDGSITVSDIAAMVGQFGHNCV